jgi:hypothetical protein
VAQDKRPERGAVCDCFFGTAGDNCIFPQTNACQHGNDLFSHNAVGALRIDDGTAPELG